MEKEDDILREVAKIQSALKWIMKLSEQMGNERLEREAMQFYLDVMKRTLKWSETLAKITNQ